tara:strand:- start:1116 stop:1304 length:189 start_codon:yes stop_codon:yes gene_type:complete
MDGVIYFLLGISITLNVAVFVLAYYYNKGQKIIMGEINQLNESLLSGMMAKNLYKNMHKGQA